MNRSKNRYAIVPFPCERSIFAFQKLERRWNGTIAFPCERGLTKHQCDLVENMCLTREAKLNVTKYGKTCRWISKFGLLDECEIAVVEDTDIIDESFFRN